MAERRKENTVQLEKEILIEKEAIRFVNLQSTVISIIRNLSLILETQRIANLVPDTSFTFFI